MTITGYTTINDEWGILIDKDLAKHDLLLRIYTTKGECDWDPNFSQKPFKLEMIYKMNLLKHFLKTPVLHY